MKDNFDARHVASGCFQQYAAQAIDKMLSSQRDQSFESMLALGKGVFEQFITEFIGKLSDGFKSGKPGVWKFLTTSLGDYNLSNVPPNM